MRQRSAKNIQRVKDREAKVEREKEYEKKKIEELKQQMEEERQLKDLQQDGQNVQMMNMSWMYQPQEEEKKKEMDDLLLGNKKFTPKSFVDEYQKIKQKEVPGALWLSNSKFEGSEKEKIINNLDNASKYREDPLALIQSAQVQAMREQLMKDPKKMEKLKKKLEKKMKKDGKKRKREEKSEEKEKPEKKEKIEKDVKKSEEKKEQKQEKKEYKPKLSEEEKKNKLEEMKNRSNLIQKQQSNIIEQKDEKLQETKVNPNFLNNIKKNVYMGDEGSVEDRIKRNIHNLSKE